MHLKVKKISAGTRACSGMPVVFVNQQSDVFFQSLCYNVGTREVNASEKDHTRSIYTLSQITESDDAISTCRQFEYNR